MPQATLLSLSQKAETTTLEHSVWRDLGAQINSRAADRVNRDEGWRGQGFPNPTTCSSFLLETWMLGCMFQFQYFLPMAKGGIKLFRAVNTTGSVCPFVLFVLPAERASEGQALPTNGSNLLLTPFFFHLRFTLCPSREYGSAFFNPSSVICDDTRYHGGRRGGVGVGVGGASMTPLQDSGSCLATASTGVLVVCSSSPRWKNKC